MTALILTNVPQDNSFKNSARRSRVFEKWLDECCEMLKRNTANTTHGSVNKLILMTRVLLQIWWKMCLDKTVWRQNRETDGSNPTVTYVNIIVLIYRTERNFTCSAVHHIPPKDLMLNCRSVIQFAVLVLWHISKLSPMHLEDQYYLR